MKAAKTELKIINNIMIAAIFILENLYESCQNGTPNYKYQSMFAMVYFRDPFMNANKSKHKKYK